MFLWSNGLINSLLFLCWQLTHFVLVKELKHCRSVGDLQCNENVKHKAKDFIRKYMSKFGEVYVREKEIE
jgi:SRI (Set2 Rpb1 interacting) domain.